MTFHLVARAVPDVRTTIDNRKVREMRNGQKYTYHGFMACRPVPLQRTLLDISTECTSIHVLYRSDSKFEVLGVEARRLRMLQLRPMQRMLILLVLMLRLLLLVRVRLLLLHLLMLLVVHLHRREWTRGDGKVLVACPCIIVIADGCHRACHGVTIAVPARPGVTAAAVAVSSAASTTTARAARRPAVLAM